MIPPNRLSVSDRLKTEQDKQAIKIPAVLNEYVTIFGMMYSLRSVKKIIKSDRQKKKARTDSKLIP